MAVLCALCGESTATTRDHIPPQGIYPKPRHNTINFNTVPACADCNNGAAVEDEEFKIFMGISTGEFRENPDSVVNSLARTIGKNQKLANQIFGTKRNVYTRLRGNILERAVAVTFDGQNYVSVVSRIIRGLYWMQRGSAIGLKSKVHVFPTQNMKLEFALSMKEFMDCLEPQHLNNETFVYKCHFLDDGESVWGMQFFKKHTVFGYAEAPET